MTYQEKRRIQSVSKAMDTAKIKVTGIIEAELKRATKMDGFGRDFDFTKDTILILGNATELMEAVMEELESAIEKP